MGFLSYLIDTSAGTVDCDTIACLVFSLQLLQLLFEILWRSLEERLQLQRLGQVLQGSAFLKEKVQEVLSLEQSEILALTSDFLRGQRRDVQTRVLHD